MSANSEKVIINETKKIQELNVSPNFAKIMCPSRMVVSGLSMSGKSTFALNLVKYRNKVYNETFDRILYALPESSLHLHKIFLTQLKECCPFVEIIEGLPDIDGLFLTADRTHKLLILDDMMTKAFGSSDVLHLMTTTSHHSNISVVLICQSMFLPSKNRLTLVRNCSEKVIFHDKVDQMQLSILSRQIFPSKPNFLRKCFDFIYEICEKTELKYLLIDASPLSDVPHNALVRSFIFPAKDGKTRPVFFFPNGNE